MEQVIDALLTQRGLACPAASARIRLIRPPKPTTTTPTGPSSEGGLGSLSSACHQHAYELGPTLGEARSLVDEVTWLISRVE